MTYINFIYIQIKVLTMVLLAIFISPFIVYPNRKKIWAEKDNETHSFRWLLSDTSERWLDDDYKNYLNSFYGIYEVFDWDYAKFEKLSGFRKFLLWYRWQVLRNGAWNFILSNPPKQGDKHGVKEIINEGEGGYWNWRNKENHGKQFVTWYVLGEKYFRYSWTRKIKYLGFGKTHVNFMVGASDDRFLLKYRRFTPDE